MKYNFPKNLKFLRENADLSLNDIAKSIGITRQTLSNYENEKSIPDIFILSKLAIFFNCSIESLVYEDQLDESSKNISDFYIENLICKINELLNIDTLSSSENELIHFLNLKKDLLNKKIAKMNLSILETENVIIELDKLINILTRNNNNISSSDSEFSKELTFNMLDTPKSHSKYISSLRKIVNINNIKSENTVKTPFFGNISAGTPRATFNDLRETFNIPSQLINNKYEYFILKISGESMNKLYKHNEYVLVKKHDNNSKSFRKPLVVSVDENESTVKFISINENNNTFALIPNSSDKSFKTQIYSFDKHKLKIFGSVECVINIEKD